MQPIALLTLCLRYLTPTLLSTSPLLRLQLIELIRTCTSSATADITPALNFASSQLAPRAATNPDFLKDLELTMSLLIFLPTETPLQPQFASLLQPTLRQDVAARVNDAILNNQGARGEAKLRSLVRLRIWAEERARMVGKDLPPVMSLGFQDAEHQEANGDAADVMVS